MAEVTTPRTKTGRAMIGLDLTPEAGYWVNLSATGMTRAILAIEDEARAAALDEARAAVEATYHSTAVLGYPVGRRWMRKSEALAAIDALRERSE